MLSFFLCTNLWKDTDGSGKVDKTEFLTAFLGTEDVDKVVLYFDDIYYIILV
jgi:hypothetical protein